MWRMAYRDQFHELNSKYLYLLENRSESPSINPGPVEMITRVVWPFAHSGILLRAVIGNITCGFIRYLVHARIIKTHH